MNMMEYYTKHVKNSTKSWHTSPPEKESDIPEDCLIDCVRIINIALNHGDVLTIIDAFTLWKEYSMCQSAHYLMMPESDIQLERELYNEEWFNDFCSDQASY